MARSGVTPTPPAMRMVLPASRRRGKLLRGDEIARISPSRTVSCRQAEPPAESVSRFTPIT
jgi:hypothetical protein